MDIQSVEVNTDGRQLDAHLQFLLQDDKAMTALGQPSLSQRLMQVKAPRPRHADIESSVQPIGIDLRQSWEANMRLHIGATILILLGVIFLLINLDIAPAAEMKKLLAQWWPLLLIVVGVVLAMRPRRAS